MRGPPRTRTALVRQRQIDDRGRQRRRHGAAEGRTEITGIVCCNITPAIGALQVDQAEACIPEDISLIALRHRVQPST